MLLGWLCFDFLLPWIGVIVDLLDQLALMVVFSGCHIFCHYIEFFQDFFSRGILGWGESLLEIPSLLYYCVRFFLCRSILGLCLQDK